VSGEAKTMAGQERPLTAATLGADLAALGVEAGMTLVVHSSLSSIGWVAGGAQGVVVALQQVLGDSGTLVVPTHSGQLSDPAQWQNPPARDASWIPLIREGFPAYDPYLTPVRQMGAIVECFLLQRDVVRSAHPHMSFAARGPNAEQVTDGHQLAYGLGEHSPLARLYELDARVLLLGVPHSNNTSIHLAEYRAGHRPKVRNGAPVLRGAAPEWVDFEDYDLDSDVFDALGADFGRDTGEERVGPVGRAESRLMRQRPLVDYAVEWMRRPA
jgi:aminoglycoside 3-N-acetyltransferase